MVAANLLLNPGKELVVNLAGRKYMWALPVMSPSKGLLGCHSVHNIMSVSVPLSDVAENNNDSKMWWLTRRLTSSRPHADKSRKHASRSTGRNKEPRSSKEQDKRNNHKKDVEDETEWAITRALIPNKFRK